ncbi:hypothetical protein [Geomesophilobacter sediminis]|uniref:Uncharacterized protein n=1 Tax=Geomesophilobacter sediminis TaxID=2798584 RepID=A0A8J7M0N7_9BACT|nr:hypothetical protein [Geomesophilobacter sediminis]MBJ6726147.1 hypothetical protein [Geomesophilobacter sediminis]
MKGLSERIVLAAIILSCGFVMQMGSRAGHAAADRDTFRPAPRHLAKARPTWLPSPRVLQSLAKSTNQ